MTFELGILCKNSSMLQDCETFILLQFEDVFIFRYLGILCILGASNCGIESFCRIICVSEL
jgi:hypothetical protein